MFIDTANLDQVKEMLSFNQFEGVTTNPKLLLKEGHPRFEQLGKIRDLKPGVLFVQLVGDTEEELLADYHELRKRFPDNDDTRMAFKIPLFEPGYRAVSAIRAEKPDECPFILFARASWPASLTVITLPHTSIVWSSWTLTHTA